ncbi:hypothetical protein J3R30DRAFT_215908 [Lentinula aciculospora]|uniref:Uncharacterized protein n=1 Tax=Lentinula aciculospora TaxID=153920 RepID=A0A9W9DML2_9AGAR|nr:hypothetical protein J3R30DRAFT_215908 [Lentinula aciculospora]
MGASRGLTLWILMRNWQCWRLTMAKKSKIPASYFSHRWSARNCFQVSKFCSSKHSALTIHPLMTFLSATKLFIHLFVKFLFLTRIAAIPINPDIISSGLNLAIRDLSHVPLEAIISVPYPGTIPVATQNTIVTMVQAVTPYVVADVMGSFGEAFPMIKSSIKGETVPALSGRMLDSNAEMKSRCKAASKELFIFELSFTGQFKDKEGKLKAWVWPDTGSCIGYVHLGQGKSTFKDGTTHYTGNITQYMTEESGESGHVLTLLEGEKQVKLQSHTEPHPPGSPTSEYSTPESLAEGSTPTPEPVAKMPSRFASVKAKVNSWQTRLRDENPNPTPHKE